MPCKISSTMTGSNPETKFKKGTAALPSQLYPTAGAAPVKQLPFSGPPKREPFQTNRGAGTTIQVKK